MDKTLIITMIASFFAGVFGSSSPIKQNSSEVKGVLVSNQSSARQLELDYNGSKLGVVFHAVSDPSRLSLFLNLDEKKTAVSVNSELGCKVLVNGGFYNKEGKPIGLFVAGGKTLSNWQENSLFNGILGVTKDGKAQVSLETRGFVNAVQAGPILVKDGISRELNIKNDEPERRVVGIVTNQGALVFLSFYNTASYYLGPNLEDLPGLLKSFERETGTQIRDAINLDGGTASAFYREGVSLTELRPIGSYFCVFE